MQKKLDNILVVLEQAEQGAQELRDLVHIPANMPDVLDGVLGDLQKAQAEIKDLVNDCQPPAKVYALEQGVYSDFRVVGTFSTREKAEKAVAVIRTDDTKIMERTLDPCSKELNEGLKLFQVRMDKAGVVLDVSKAHAYDLEQDARFYVDNTVLAERGPFYCGNTWARDGQHAVKICNEFRSRDLANNTGGE